MRSIMREDLTVNKQNTEKEVPKCGYGREFDFGRGCP